mmetsp:Transcript_3398/g.4911  ORF Transcript_3398/g.4911 Transcript_3398/m.4911 type:complete len:244 (+) Transcript_3398:301-1032(+)
MRVLVAAAALGCVSGQNLPLPPLNYGYDALEPYIDAETMKIHHLKHHQGYTNKMNAALKVLREDAEHKHLAKLGIDKLLEKLDKVPKKLRGAIQNNGGGYVNHEIYFKGMTPGSAGKPAPGSDLEKALIKTFGSLEGFQDTFAQTALGVFGSGWAWLCQSKEIGALEIVTTANQDIPPKGLVPIIGIDLWEHAYCKYRAFAHCMNVDLTENRPQTSKYARELHFKLVQSYQLGHRRIKILQTC